jgi:hypothetical protein
VAPAPAAAPTTTQTTPAPAPPTPAPPSEGNSSISDPDDSYLAQLINMGLAIQNRDGALATAHQICIRRQQGQSKHDVVGWVAENQPIGHVNAGRVVDAATATYCPQYG